MKKPIRLFLLERGYRVLIICAKAFRLFGRIPPLWPANLCMKMLQARTDLFLSMMGLTRAELERKP